MEFKLLKKHFWTQGLFLALCLLLCLPSQGLQAQELGVPQSQILTLSWETMYGRSAYGRRIANEIEAESAVLAAENERIIAELSQEEQNLTERRSEMEPEAFRVLVDAFDRKVQSHRNGQRAKLEDLDRKQQQAGSVFLQLAQPVLEALMQEAGAVAVLERSNVFLRSKDSDITDIAISRIDATIGDGSNIRLPAPEQ
ncbi:OmpH family outer membrane protein [Phaeobacter gallaeciensis]|uniref:OmpH family outer membrane protein n=2 Tax=Roseobacteraceae TaxID=2854170 RepID=A0A366WTC3_9RHOB|nr:OmpH family outer membrane protein [Phaeobacter gallaeciensis]MBT3140611.1 OmpH family outer membrane protein [Falsiruegeria litorea]MBT8170350.1 OmpH family outer membrane protein [Falsiruegeria litorea]RBW52583.1 OmpH family outer membrane protein [Phaeobacter gallaeciensis]